MPSNLTMWKMAAMAAWAAISVLSAPIASADDPPGCAADDLQCQEQQKQQEAKRVAGQATDQVQQGLDQANRGLNQANKGNPNNVDLGAPNCSVIDGVPTLIPPGGLTLGPGPHTTAFCWLVYGVTPHN